MLVVERKVGEEVVIQTSGGEIITVALVRLAGSRAKIGIEAPESCLVLRQELIERDRWREERR